MGNHDVLGWSSREKVGPERSGIRQEDDHGRARLEAKLLQLRPQRLALCGARQRVSGQGATAASVQEPRVGKEQLEWLGYDLGSAGDRPKIAVVHVAAFCNIGQISGDPKHLAMDGSMVIWDTRELRKVLERHNVKLLLQGHSHRVEDTFWNGVWYVTSPAASGAWWAGSWTGSEPGFHRPLQRRPLTWSHETYPWEPHLDPKDSLERKKIADQLADRAAQQRRRDLECAGRKQS